VLPFSDLSGDPTLVYFSDGVTDNLTTDLSVHVSGLFVISRNTAFTFKGKNVDVQQVGRDLGVRYVLEGSVQRSGDQVRVNAQLVDAQTGAHLWAERFQEERRELFALQDRITGRIANTLGIQLVQAAARDTDPSKYDPAAADLVMQGRAFIGLPESLENLNQAETLFRQALVSDDRNVDALTGLSETLNSKVLNFGSSQQDLRDALMKESEELADRAIAIDPNRPEAHFARGMALRAERRILESTHEYEITISSDPSHAQAYAFLGAAMFRLGQPEKSIPLIERAMRLSPRDPLMSIFEWQLATAHMFLRHDDLAIEWFLKARTENSNYVWILRDLGAAYALKGDVETARKIIAEVLKASPNQSIARLKVIRDSDDPEYLRLREETLYKGLRIAGLPE
jgi:TolB-like protein